MRILLIKPKHIGDSLLLTPTIVALKRDYPAAEIWVVIRRGCETILAGCPEIDRLLTVAPVDKSERRSGDWWPNLKTAAKLLGLRADYVFELGDGHRARLMARLPRSSQRYSVLPTDERAVNAARKSRLTISSFAWQDRHRVEKDFYTVSEFLPLAQPIPPVRFARERARDWAPAAKFGSLAVMQVGKRQDSGRWNRDGWAEVGRWLLQRVDGIVIACGSAPSEMAEANWIREKLGARAIATLGQADWPELAGLLYRAKIYVGLDTAATHLAAACQCPSVVLFGFHARAKLASVAVRPIASSRKPPPIRASEPWPPSRPKKSSPPATL